MDVLSSAVIDAIILSVSMSLAFFYTSDTYIVVVVVVVVIKYCSLLTYHGPFQLIVLCIDGYQGLVQSLFVVFSDWHSQLTWRQTVITRRHERRKK